MIPKTVLGIPKRSCHARRRRAAFPVKRRKEEEQKIKVTTNIANIKIDRENVKNVKSRIKFT